MRDASRLHGASLVQRAPRWLRQTAWRVPDCLERSGAVFATLLTLRRSPQRELLTCVVIAILVGTTTRVSSVHAQSIAPAPKASELAFRDAAVAPTPGYHGPVFKLSHDYPTQLSEDCIDCSWLTLPSVAAPIKSKLPFAAQPINSWADGPWAEYLRRILEYVKEGQDPNLADAVGFQTNVRGQTRWFNVPWMAVDATQGREFVHGTTNERTARLSDLVGPQFTFGHALTTASSLPGARDDCSSRYPRGFETWSVGYYNERGGYAIGKAIGTDGVPRMAESDGKRILAGLPFPKGTLVVKILTTSAPDDCVPHLKGSPVWTVDRHVLDPDRNKGYQCARTPQPSRIVQVDVAVVDERSPTRWFYGTFVYDGNRPGSTFWDRLVPLGIQWGSDPWTFPAVPRSESNPLQQTVLNPSANLPQHQGCGQRLAGPVDNQNSSCVSCHAAAYAAPSGQRTLMGMNVPAPFGFAGMCGVYSEENSAYFQNTTFPQAYPGGRYPDAISLDTSLQLQVAMTQYGLFATRNAPECKDPNQF